MEETSKSSKTDPAASIEIREHHIESILGKSPTWLVRWGMSIMACIIFLLLGVSYFFSYPDTVSVPITIMPEKVPVSVFVPYPLELREVYVGENTDVRRGDTLLSGQTEHGVPFFLESPVSGKIAFSRVLLSGFRLSAGESVLSVVPPSHGDYVGIVQIPVRDMSQLRVGQSADIKLDLYPYMQYGILQGKVSFIAQLPVDGYYSVLVTLATDNVSSYGKDITLQPAMTGTVNIITRNMSLLERLIVPVRR